MNQSKNNYSSISDFARNAGNFRKEKSKCDDVQNCSENNVQSDANSKENLKKK